MHSISSLALKRRTPIDSTLDLSPVCESRSITREMTGMALVSLYRDPPAWAHARTAPSAFLSQKPFGPGILVDWPWAGGLRSKALGACVALAKAIGLRRPYFRDSRAIRHWRELTRPSPVSINWRARPAFQAFHTGSIDRHPKLSDRRSATWS